MKKEYSFKIKKDSEYLKSLEEQLGIYVNWVNNNYKEYFGEVKTIVKHINDAVISYYKSDFFSAIQYIQKIVDSNNLLSCDSKIGEGGYADALFKARVVESTENIGHEDMLHIPFNHRNIVSAQRFSLNGTPCIYLAKSSYTCWLELNKPEENRFFVSAFRFAKEKTFLDLTCLTWEKIESDQKIGKDLKEKLCTFPLIIATSFQVEENTGRHFHSEYIVSGLLMNVIAVSGKFDGVAYYSKKFSDKERYYPINICFALLAKFDGKKYTSDIGDMEWTEPMLLREYSMIKWDERYDQVVFDCGGNKVDKIKPFTLIGKDVAYCDTLMHDFDRWIIEKCEWRKESNISL